MKYKSFLLQCIPKHNYTLLIGSILIATLISCSKNIEYTKEYIDQTSGRYLFNEENIIDVYYEDQKLYLNWGESKVIEPLVLADSSFFIADIYQKLRFVQHPQTNNWYLSIVDNENEDRITYDYVKVADDYQTPDMHLERGDYQKALEGYLTIKAEDSTSVFLDEGELNSLGYRLLRREKYDDAVEVFKMNVVLFPESANVYDSLADGYLAQGDSLEAYTNFKKTLELNNANSKAKNYVEAYRNAEN